MEPKKKQIHKPRAVDENTKALIQKMEKNNSVEKLAEALAIAIVNWMQTEEENRGKPEERK